MARRRLYVFATIIVLGLLIGIFWLPNGGEQNAAMDEGQLEDLAQNPADKSGGLPALDFEKEPAARAKQLVAKAQQETVVREKYKLLVEAYRADQRGLWGGHAAAEIGDIFKSRNSTELARQWYSSAERASLSARTAARVKRELAALTVAADVPAIRRIKFLTYKVQPGDSLWKIARRYATSIDAIKNANNLKRDMIRVGKKLRVPKGPFDALVTKRNHTLQLLQDGKPVKIYRVGLGKNNGTPVGSFVVTSKLVNPVWYSEEHGRIPHGDRRNVLGSRWMGFNGRVGIHGTRKTEENTIGKNMSDGCVRMRDADVKELYGFLVESKSKVTVVE
jgi:lipoprotein-anchoring transpeptidase ErfK/SrfK